MVTYEQTRRTSLSAILYDFYWWRDSLILGTFSHTSFMQQYHQYNKLGSSNHTVTDSSSTSHTHFPCFKSLNNWSLVQLLIHISHIFSLHKQVVTSSTLTQNLHYFTYDFFHQFTHDVITHCQLCLLLFTTHISSKLTRFPVQVRALLKTNIYHTAINFHTA